MCEVFIKRHTLYDIFTQNTTHIRSYYYASHNSNTNRINQE
jgi:hypothetical protein